MVHIMSGLSNYAAVHRTEKNTEERGKLVKSVSETKRGYSNHFNVGDALK